MLGPQLTTRREIQTPVLQVKNLKTYFYTFAGVVKAVDGVSFGIDEGETLGLCGESGSGKTTVSLSILRIVPTPGRIISGKVLLDGNDLFDITDSEMRRIRWKKISLVFQGALNALNPMHRVVDQIKEAILIHEKVSMADAQKRAKELLEMVDIESSRVNDYPHEFSGGMKQRVLIAMALACSPRVLIADEPTTALDVMVSARLMKLIENLQKRIKLSMILITHDLSVIADVCDRVACMYAGKIVENAEVIPFFECPIHPYSKGLIRAFPSLAGTRKRLEPIPGSPPDLLNPPPGCRFHTRCPDAQEICRKKEPKLVEVKRGHYVACHFVNEVAGSVK